jgi:3-oxoacyl-[acyl-carrier protein] reductase
LAAEGASVIVNATARTGADAVVTPIKAKGGKAVAVQGNVTQPDEITRLFAETKKAFGKVDILVNNAGAYEFALLEKITLEHIQKHLNLNVAGLLLTTKEAVNMMGPEGGSFWKSGGFSETILITIRFAHRW